MTCFSITIYIELVACPGISWRGCTGIGGDKSVVRLR